MSGTGGPGHRRPAGRRPALQVSRRGTVVTTTAGPMPRSRPRSTRRCCCPSIRAPASTSTRRRTGCESSSPTTARTYAPTLTPASCSRMPLNYALNPFGLAPRRSPRSSRPPPAPSGPPPGQGHHPVRRRRPRRDLRPGRRAGPTPAQLGIPPADRFDIATDRRGRNTAWLDQRQLAPPPAEGPRAREGIRGLTRRCGPRVPLSRR